MIIVNNSLLSTITTTTAKTTVLEATTVAESFDSYLNSTIEINNSSSLSIIITIIILSCLSISGWIFMSYALFGRSEAYRAKPEDQFGTSSLSNDLNRANNSSMFGDFE